MTGLSPSGHTALEHAHLGTPQERGGDVASWVQSSTITHTEAQAPHTLVHYLPRDVLADSADVRGGPCGSEKQSDMPEVAHVACGCGLGSGSQFSASHLTAPHWPERSERPKALGVEGGKFEPAETCVWAPAGTAHGRRAPGTPKPP